MKYTVKIILNTSVNTVAIMHYGSAGVKPGYVIHATISLGIVSHRNAKVEISVYLKETTWKTDKNMHLAADFAVKLRKMKK